MTDAPPALVDTLVSDCLDREANIPTMYRDASSHGWVTVGAGHKLNSAMEASRLPFEVDGRPATVSEVSSDYVRVMSMPPARLAASYALASSPRLPDGFGLTLCRLDVAARLPEILRIVPQLYDHPIPVARALMTIDYTSGAAGLAGFPHMLASLAARDYRGIVDRREYHMAPPATDATNGKLHDWFAEAAGPADS